MLLSRGDNIYLGSVNSVPSQLQNACITGDRVNISWDLLPCHLQNGADIIDYTIQYSLTSGGEAWNASSSDRQFVCTQKPRSRYTCRVAATLLELYQTYTFQVAARNSDGVGPFSDPVIIRSGVQGTIPE